MDLQEQIKKLLNRIGEDDSLRSLFQKDPVAAAEKVLGIDLPDDMMEKIIDGVKAKPVSYTHLTLPTTPYV